MNYYTIPGGGDMPNKAIMLRGHIQNAAKYFDVDPELIYKKSNKQNVVTMRQKLALVLKWKGYKLKEIGRALGGKHHTTIIHNQKEAVKFCGTEKDYYFDCIELSKHLKIK